MSVTSFVIKSFLAALSFVLPSDISPGDDAVRDQSHEGSLPLSVTAHQGQSVLEEKIYFKYLDIVCLPDANKGHYFYACLHVFSSKESELLIDIVN